VSTPNGGKVNPNKTIQKHRSKDELNHALILLCAGTPLRSIPPQIDDSDIVLSDAIAELMDARQALADVQMWMHGWLAKSGRH
jgi:hypothetical protein